MLTRTRHYYAYSHTHTVTHAQRDRDRCTQPHVHKHTHNYTQMHPNGLLNIIASFPPALHVPLSRIIPLQYAQQPASLWRAALITAQEWWQPPHPCNRKIPLCSPDASAGTDIPAGSCRCLLHISNKKREHCWFLPRSFIKGRSVSADVCTADTSHSFYCLFSTRTALMHRLLPHHNIISSAALSPVGLKHFTISFICQSQE